MIDFDHENDGRTTPDEEDALAEVLEAVGLTPESCLERVVLRMAVLGEPIETAARKVRESDL